MPPDIAEQLDPMAEQEQDSAEGASSLDPIADNPFLQGVVRDLAKHFIGLDKWVRRSEVIDTRRQRFYWRGDQYIYWKSDAVGFIPAISGSAVDAGGGTEIPRYTDVYNIYTPYGESILSTLIQNPPVIDWQPAEATKGPDISAADAAEKYQQTIEQNNDRKNLQSEVGRLFYTDGRVVLEVETIDEDEDNPYEQITSHGVLESKVIPVTAKEQKEVIALILSRELDVCDAKDRHPEVADQITEGTTSLGESAYERIARLGVMQGTRLLMQAGDAFSHLVTRHKVFLRPSAIEKAPKNTRDELHQLFAKGIKVIFCGETYCGSRNASMDDHTTIGFPTPGDGMSRPSLGKRVVPLQDVFNDEVNEWHEAHDYCIPTTFMYSATGDIEAVREQISQPGNIVPITDMPPGAQGLADAFFESVLESVPATLPQLIMFIQGPLAQFITGAFPALFGGDTKQNDTAKGIAIQRDQAMGRMGIPWSSMQVMFASIFQQAVRLAVERMQDGDTFTYKMKGRDGEVIGQNISVADLKQGSFKAVPDIDSGFPETTSAKRETLQALMALAEKNPVIADTMTQPDNLELIHETLGLADLVIPGAMARNKQLGEIDQLLKEIPIEPPMQVIQQMAQQQAEQGNQQLLQAMANWEQAVQIARTAGKEPPPKPLPDAMLQPSVPIDSQYDFHQYEYQEVKDWLSSPAARREKAKGNFQGLRNVRLHGMAHFQQIEKQQQPKNQPDPTVEQAKEKLAAIGSIPPEQAIGGKALPAVVSANKELIDSGTKGAASK